MTTMRVWAPRASKLEVVSHGRCEPMQPGPRGNYLGKFGPYFTDRYKTPWGEAVNLDGPGSDTVRRFFVDNACMWLRDYHVDGLRIDAVHAIVDMSAVHFLEQLAAAVHKLATVLGRRLVVIAESDLNNPRIIRSPDAGGYGLDQQWIDDFHHALHTALTGERSGYYADFRGLADLARSLRRGYVYEGQYAASRGHGHGRPACVRDGSRFVACMQNHDQVGNRAAGERMHHLAGMARTRIGAALLLTAPFVPLLFQGEEWAASSPFQYFTAHEDAALAEAVRNGRRREFAAFGWDPAEVPDPQYAATFERSRLQWEERNGGAHAAMLDWYRALIRLRRTEPDLRNGDLSQVQTTCDSAGTWLTIRRGGLLVACNLGRDEAVLPLDPSRRQPVLVLSSGENVRLDSGSLFLPPDSVAIVR